MSGPRFYRKLGLLAKIETTEGTDAVPTGAANALLATNCTITPMEAQQVSRDLLLPYMGNQGVQLHGISVKMSFDIEIASSGTAGTAPAWGPLLRMCGLAEVVTVGTSAVYSPVSGSFECGTIYWNADGVRHVALGTRGNVKADFTPGKVPHFTFELMGMYGTVTDQALPAVTLTAFKTPLMVNKANTTLSLFGALRKSESVSFDLGQKVEGRFLIGGEGIVITDRSATGTAVIEAGLVADQDWFGVAKARTRGALSLVHGTVAGAIVQIDAPAVEIDPPTQGQTQGVINYSLPLGFCPSAGNDELTITAK